MFRIYIILMLSTIIHDQDCCSSFTLFNRKSIHLYPNTGLELSIHKPIQFPQNNHNHHSINQQQTPPSPPSDFPTPKIPLSPGHREVKAGSLHKHLLLESNENSEQSDEDHLRLNRSYNLDYLEISQKLEEKTTDYENENVVTTTSSITTTNNTTTETLTTTTTISTTATTTPTTTLTETEPNYDAQYKLISEIVSLECVDFFKLEFCLNGGRCFLYPILNHSLSSCECAEGFVGERCEAKSYEFIPHIRPRIVLAKTRGGPLIIGLAVVDILFLFFLLCKNYNRN